MCTQAAISVGCMLVSIACRGENSCAGDSRLEALLSESKVLQFRQAVPLSSTLFLISFNVLL
jgi:hypothetical protein